MKKQLSGLLNNFKMTNIIICLIVSMFISILQILGRFLDVRSNGLNVSIIRIGIEGIVFFIICNLTLVLLWKGGKWLLNTKPFEKSIFSKIYFWQPVILLLWLPCFLAYFPGIYSYDGEPQLIQYTSGQLDNHHPVIHTLIIGSCYDLGQWLQAQGINIDGLAFYTIIQVLLLSFAMAYLLRFLVQKNAGKAFVILFATYICLFPTMPLMAISSTKDTFFAAFFVLFLTELAGIYTAKNEQNGDNKDLNTCGVVIENTEKLQISRSVQNVEKLHISDLIRLFVFSAGCMFFRRNGYYVITILLMFFVIVAACQVIRSRKNILLKNPLYAVAFILLISVLFFSITEKTVIKCTNALEGESAEALSIPLQQMARAFKSNDNAIRIKYGERLTTYISETGLCNYRPLITDGVKQYFNNEYFATNKADFIKVYVELGKDYPGPYLFAVLYLTKGDWHIMDTTFCEVYKDWWRDRTGYLITDATKVFAGDFVKKSNIWPGVRNLYERFATDCSFTKFVPFQVICSPAFYVFLSFLGALALILNKKKGLYSVVGAILLYLLTMFAGPCVLIRYIFPVMVSIPLLAWCVLNSND